MQRWRGLDAVPANWGRCVVTIGVFDGVHLGHQELIGEAVAIAAREGVPSVLLTFDPHPSEVVRPGTHPPVLTTTTRKAELVEAIGVDVFCALPFTPELAALSAADFVQGMLVDQLHASVVVIGQNFRFGNRAGGDLATLTALGASRGFQAVGVPLLVHEAVPLSASFVRTSLEAGDVQAAARALGRPHRVDGVVVHGDQRGRELGFPTANLSTERYAMIPADGVYAGRLVALDEHGGTVPDGVLGVAAISVGTNPTFDGQDRVVESFVLEFSGDLYGRRVGVEFLHRLRGMVKYEGLEPLIVQMTRDVEQTRALMLDGA
ncbi:MAG: riboflavin biosynthesis protein RibF [Jatrophihabitantaceae bacterium]|nr:riboflavin biosynthesis protein RibF [Jatrophihabitantaceae bacterium]